jgi:hypothetical protein
VVTQWGSFGFFGPLTVLPEYWNQGVAQRLLEATMKTFDRWNVRHTGLFTFAQSAKHVALYQKFGYWPGHLTAVMTRAPQAAVTNTPPILLSSLSRTRREEALQACAGITDAIDAGLDLTGEIRAVLAQGTGDVVLTTGQDAPDAFAICLNGPGSEGGAKTCYVKFAAARSGSGAGQRFEKLLDACDAFAASRNANLEAGVNLARRDAFLRMKHRGYKVTTQGVAMHRPHTGIGWSRANAYVIDDWR